MKEFKKLKTVVITRFPYESEWGGEEHHTIVLARYLKKRGLHVVFMGSCKVLLEKFTSEGFETLELWGGKMIVTKWELLKSFVLFPLLMMSFKKAFQKLKKKYDIKAFYCLSLNEKLFLTPIVTKASIPVTWVEHQEIRSWLTKNPWKRRYKKISNSVKIIPISKKNEGVLLDELQLDKRSIEFIVNGVDVEAIQSVSFEVKKNSILAANRMIPKKGLYDLVEALLLLKKRGVEFSAKILGEGEERRKIEDFIAKNEMKNEVEVENFLKKENWIKSLNEAEVYVSCARDTNETFSLNSAEAMAAGCKCVITSCSGIASFVEDGKNAFLVEPKNPNKLADKIIEAINASEEISVNAKEHAKKIFNQKDMLEKYYSLIIRA